MEINDVEEMAVASADEGEGGAGGDGDGGGAGEQPEEEEEEQYDITLTASHSYMGGSLEPVPGRRVLEAGWSGVLRVLAHHGAVFPGETVPMLVPAGPDAALLATAIQEDKLFGLLCPDETGTLVSGYGVVCEVYEAASLAEAAAGEAEAGEPLSFKARATHRFRVCVVSARAVPAAAFARARPVRVRVLPDVLPGAPLRQARLHSLDAHRHSGHIVSRRVRGMDAALTSWPRFVYDIFDYGRMRDTLREYFRTLNLERLPEEPVSLSFWVASNLPLSARDRLALFVVDNALLRLRMELRLIARKSALCCSSCMSEIARRDAVFAMSSEGAHSNYTNPGGAEALRHFPSVPILHLFPCGYMHDLVTVTLAVNTRAPGSRPCAEFSWFPGYAWTIVVCDTCAGHVGWRFDALRAALRPQQFYGLCRNLVQPRADPAEAEAEAEAPALAPAPALARTPTQHLHYADHSADREHAWMR